MFCYTIRMRFYLAIQLFALSVIVCGGASAFTALQFDATASRSVSRTDGAVTAWVSTRQGVIANPCHAAGGGWTSPQYDRDGSIDFFSATGMASPLSFPHSESGLVSRVFIVADGFDAVMVCSLAIHAVSKEPLRGGVRSIPLPEWFMSLGYDIQM